MPPKTKNLPLDLNAAFETATSSSPAQFVWEDIFAASRADDVAQVKLILAAQPELANAVDGFSDTLLVDAVRQQKHDMVEVLLKASANPDKPGTLQAFAIVLAVSNKDLRMVTLLLDNKADPDVKHDFDFTALMVAAEAGQEAIAEKLLERKASKEIADDQGFTALRIAGMHGHHGMVRLLKKHGAKIDARDKGGDSLLDVVIQKRDDRMFDTLMDLGVDYLSGNKTTTDPVKSNTTPVMWAAQADNTYALQKLKDKGAPLDTWNAHGMTPLIFSAIEGAGGTAKLLIDWNVPLDPPDPRRHSARRHAELKGHQHVVNLIDNAYGRRIGNGIATLQLGGGEGLDAPVKAKFKKKGPVQ